MKSKFASVLFSRRLYFLVFCLAMLAFQIGTNAQQSQSGIEPPDCYFLEPVCIMDPLTVAV